MAAVSVAATFTNNVKRLSELQEEVLDYLATAGDWWTLSFAESSVAGWYWANGNLAAAEASLINATAAAKRTGSPLAIAFAALSRGRMAGFTGRMEEARVWLDEAIETYQKMENDRFVLIARSDLAHALRVGGQIDAAEALYRVTIEGWRDLGNRGAIANQLECLAYLSIARGEYPRAARVLGGAEAIRQEAGAIQLPYEAAEYEAAVTALTEALGPEAKQAAWAEGPELTIGQTIDLALSDP